MLTVLDLPEPEAPVMATNSPGRICRSTPSSARTWASPSPYTRETPRSSSRGSGRVEGAGPASLNDVDAISLPSFRGEIDDDARAGRQLASLHGRELPIRDTRVHRHSAQALTLEDPDRPFRAVPVLA